MKISILRQKDQQTIGWSGGTTTQLAISPPGSSLQKRDFDYRISTASVEAETSTFSYLPGIKRVLMILEGKLELEHPGRYTKVLHKQETDTFGGDWNTRGSGRVTDFNLMMTGAVSGSVEMITLFRKEKKELALTAKTNVMGVLVHKGKMEFRLCGEKFDLDTGDFILVSTAHEMNSPTVSAVEYCELVKVEVVVIATL